jgi:hypothetical protein
MGLVVKVVTPAPGFVFLHGQSHDCPWQVAIGNPHCTPCFLTRASRCEDHLGPHGGWGPGLKIDIHLGWWGYTAAARDGYLPVTLMVSLPSGPVQVS